MGKVVPLSNADAAACAAQFGAAPYTKAVPLLPADASQQQWLAARRSTIGASELSSVLGLAPPAQSSAFALWWRKANGWDIEPSESMRIGSLLEDLIGRLFAEAQPDMLVFRPGAALWGHREHTFLSCTPDFLAVVANDAWRPGNGQPRVLLYPVECKSDEGGKGWGRAGTDEVPEHHRVQGLDQAEIMGAQGAFFARMAHKRFRWYYVPYTTVERKTMQAEWIPAAYRFHRSLAEDRPPAIDGSAATTEVLELLNPDLDPEAEATINEADAALFRKATLDRRAAEETYSLYANRLRHLMGNARFAVDPKGVRLMRRDVYKVEEHVVRAHPVDRVVPLT